MKKRLVILDTHAILHRAYHALPDFTSGKGEPTGALYGLVSMLVKIIADFKPDYIVAAFDLPGDTHRHTVYQDYKAHRAPTDDALVSQLKRSREVLDALGVVRYECEGFEADDVIGTIAQEMKQHGDVDVIIASGDMDMLQLVDDDRVRVFTFRKGLADTVLYNEAAIVERFGFGPLSIPDLKGIMGDTSDNIKGVKGVGEGSALKLIKTYGSIEQVYVALKTKGVEAVAGEAGIQKRFAQLMFDNEKDALFSKMLAEIRRDAPIAFALPAQEWAQTVSPQKVLDMMAEFDFKSLLPRIKKLLEPELFDQYIQDEPVQEAPAVPQEEVEPLALAVWVLDSNATEPTLDDIYRVGKSTQFEEAKKNILADIAAKELSFVYEHIELPLAPVLRSMEKVGIAVDSGFLRTLATDYNSELEKISARIFAAAGQEFNINSPKQLGDVLFDKLGLAVKNQKKTAGGQRSTRESELEKMRALHPIVGDILAHRELQKLLSTYINTLPTLLDQEGRLHTSYVQTGTTTGRLSSQNPNLQNIPIKTELGRAIRHAFVAGKGMQLLSFDYSQIELRIAAFLSGDETLIDIFKNGRDVHTEVAMRVFHIEAAEVTYEQRRRAKVINFGILYGMGVNALKDSLGTERKDAQVFYDQYFAAFPRLAAYLEETKADAARLGYTQTYFGRRRYFDGIKSPIPYVRAAAERMAINAPVQGTAADIIKLAMVEIGAWIQTQDQDDIRLLLQVHDELVFEVAQCKVAALSERIKEIMEHVLPKEKCPVPLTVEGKVGENWGDMKPL